MFVVTHHHKHTASVGNDVDSCFFTSLNRSVAFRSRLHPDVSDSVLRRCGERWVHRAERKNGCQQQ